MPTIVVDVMPKAELLDPQGKLAHTFLGPVTAADLADELLRRAPPAFFELTGISADRGSPPTV